MVKHVVLFQFSPDVDEATRCSIRERFRKNILALKAQLSIIRNIEVGFNINGDEKWDICLDSTFDSLDDVRTYAVFPPHQAAASELKPYLSGRSCVDYEL